MDTETLLSVKRGYFEKPWLRRDQTCKAIVFGAGFGAFCLIAFGSRLAKFSDNRIFQTAMVVIIAIGIVLFTAAIVSVCVVAMTGPIYTRQIDFAKGRLQRWGFLERAILIVVSAACLSVFTLIASIALNPPKFIDAQTPITIGDVQLEISDARVGKIALETPFTEAESESALLTLQLTFTNSGVSEKTVNFGFSHDLRSTDLLQNDGKRLQQVEFSPMTQIKGAFQSKTVAPGDSVTHVIVFESPSEDAEYLDLTFPAAACAEEGFFRFRIPVAMIRR